MILIDYIGCFIFKNNLENNQYNINVNESKLFV